ncbi:chromatin modification-related protein EAF1 [Cyclospora cayetanensis]|uniref:Chromatin modification-related protein EAF1 n=1 Tax=Cyclospora cayetanensis TaxID=88456 RepID=A0A6P6RV09_9EIME|nr:chromatin modification-related protein EAF1 [Cyclospora cayetanensis]
MEAADGAVGLAVGSEELRQEGALPSPTADGAKDTADSAASTSKATDLDLPAASGSVEGHADAHTPAAEATEARHAEAGEAEWGLFGGGADVPSDEDTAVAEAAGCTAKLLYAHGLANKPLRYEEPAEAVLFAVKKKQSSLQEAEAQLQEQPAEIQAALQRRLLRMREKAKQLLPFHPLPSCKLLPIPELLLQQEESQQQQCTEEQRQQDNQQHARDMPCPPLEQQREEDKQQNVEPSPTAAPACTSPANSPPQIVDPKALKAATRKGLQVARQQAEQIRRMQPHDILFGHLYHKLRALKRRAAHGEMRRGPTHLGKKAQDCVAGSVRQHLEGSIGGSIRLPGSCNVLWCLAGWMQAATTAGRIGDAARNKAKAAAGCSRQRFSHTQTEHLF